jgi:hypothetical protein
MPLVIPTPETVYRGNYSSLPASTLKPPIEQNRTIPVEIQWLRDTIAPGYTIHFNARSQQTLAISQISALHIDNSQNGSSIHVIFQDTQFEVIAGPNQTGFYPVVTNSLEFWCSTDLVPLAGDKTIIQVLNFLPPPILFASALGGSGVGTVRQVDTVAPIQGGPITDQGSISLATPLAINFGGTGGVTPPAALDNLSGASGATAGPLTRSAGGTWAVAAGLSSPITVPNGGTARTTLTATAPLIGNGTGPVISSAIQTDDGTTLRVSTNLVIGTASPAVTTPQQILVNSAANPPPAAIGTPELWLADEAAATEILLDNFGTVGGPQLLARKARGTAGAPTALGSGDVILSQQAYGRGATVYTGVARATLNMATIEAWTDAAQGTEIALATTAIGTTTTAQRVDIRQGVIIGNAAPDPGQGALVLNQNAVAPTPAQPVANIAIYAQDANGATARLTAFGAVAGAQSFVQLARSRGTAAAPATLNQGDFIGQLNFIGYDGTAWSGSQAAITVQSNPLAGGNWSASDHGTVLAFWTTPALSTSMGSTAFLDNQRGWQAQGTTTNDNAAAGWVGEFLSNSSASTAISSATVTGVLSVTLTAGDWDVWGVLCISASGMNATYYAAALNTVGNALPTRPNGGAFNEITASALGSTSLPTGSMRVSVATTQAIWLVAYATYSSGTFNTTGFLGARRRR